MSIIIREACIDDANQIQTLNEEGLNYYYPLNNTKERLLNIIKKPFYKILVAVLSDVVVGYIHLSDYECTYADSLKNILAIVVAPEHRGKGIGKVLISAAECWAKETESSGIRLSSGFNREEAHKFYNACGYTMRKEQKNFIKYI